MKYAIWDVDTQNDFMEEKGKLSIRGAGEINDKLSRILNYARKEGIQITGSVDWHSLGDEEISDEPDYKTTYNEHCIAGTWGADKIIETRPKDPLWIDTDGKMEKGGKQVYGSLSDVLKEHQGEVYMRKQKFDVFSNPHTEEVLKALELTDIIVMGVALEVCNDFAITGLAQRGYNVYAVTDAMKPISEESRQDIYDKWKGLGVKLVTTEEVLEGKL